MQPKLFGEVPINFDFPCFDLNAQEIRVIEAPKKSEDENKEEASESSAAGSGDSDETIGGFKVEDILNVVSKTADQGIKLISDLFGIADDDKPETAAAESKSIPEVVAVSATNVTKNP